MPFVKTHLTLCHKIATMTTLRLKLFTSSIVSASTPDAKLNYFKGSVKQSSLHPNLANGLLLLSSEIKSKQFNYINNTEATSAINSARDDFLNAQANMSTSFNRMDDAMNQLIQLCDWPLRWMTDNPSLTTLNSTEVSEKLRLSAKASENAKSEITEASMLFSTVQQDLRDMSTHLTRGINVLSQGKEQSKEITARLLRSFNQKNMGILSVFRTKKIRRDRNKLKKEAYRKSQQDMARCERYLAFLQASKESVLTFEEERLSWVDLASKIAVIVNELYTTFGKLDDMILEMEAGVGNLYSRLLERKWDEIKKDAQSVISLIGNAKSVLD